MSLKYAILGLLTFEPMTGYTLKTGYFDRSVAFFWPADQAQIYRTLQALETEELVTSEVIDEASRPSRKLYRITEKGENNLKDWLGTSHPPQTDRFHFLVQLYFCRLIEKHQLLDILHRQMEYHRHRLAYFTDFQMPEASSEEMKRQLRFGAFTLDFGRRFEVMQIEWLEAVISDMENW